MNLRFTAIIAIGLLGLTSVRADEKLPLLQAGTDIYRNVTVLSVSATDVYFTYNDGRGMANAKLNSLNPDLQKHFHYNSDRAGEAQQKQAQADAEYRLAVIHAAPVDLAPDETRPRPPEIAHASDLTWSTDFSHSLDQARADDKMVLLDFTGSDWCPWCIKFDHEVLATDEFATYARSKLELVLVDFPRTKPQDDGLKQANRALAEKYNVHSYPTYVLVNYAGKELGRQTGYRAGGPDTFIAELDKFNRQ